MKLTPAHLVPAAPATALFIGGPRDGGLGPVQNASMAFHRPLEVTTTPAPDNDDVLQIPDVPVDTYHLAELVIRREAIHYFYVHHSINLNTAMTLLVAQYNPRKPTDAARPMRETFWAIPASVIELLASAAKVQWDAVVYRKDRLFVADTPDNEFLLTNNKEAAHYNSNPRVSPSPTRIRRMEEE